MFNWLIRRKLAAFERKWGYDTSYVREIVDEAGASAIMPLGGLQKIGEYRRDVPIEVYSAALLTASRASDCGPCLQLCVAKAEAAGVAPALIRSVLAGDLSALSAPVRLGVELARATIARDASGEAARAEIVRRWGKRALISIAYGLVAAQAYPTFKYALGHGHACVRVRVGGENLPLRLAPSA